MPLHSTDVLHSDLALARRLERAEGQSGAEFAHARRQVLPEAGGTVIEVAGAIATFDGVESPCTQTFGLGLFKPVTDTHLNTLEQFFDDRGAITAHEICPVAGAELVGRLCDRGYRPIEISNVLFRPIQLGLELRSARARTVHARPIESHEHALWARVATQGWADTAPGLDEFFNSLARVNPHRAQSFSFLAEREGQPIAAGAVSLFENVALLAGASTIPRFRGQGAQLALLEARLQFGAERGCDLAMIVAEPASASQRNAERQGFQVAYTRTKWSRPPRSG